MTEYLEQIRGLWERAAESIRAAEELLHNGHPDFAASRAYYATFYAASAVLLGENKIFSKHTGIISAIHKDFVKAGKIPTEIGRIISTLYDLRNLGDYGGEQHVGSDEARKAIEDAKLFVDTLRPFLPESAIIDRASDEKMNSQNLPPPT